MHFTRQTRFGLHRLDAYRVALDLYAGVEEFAAGFPRGYVNQREQLRRAAAAIVLNLAEGANRNHPKDKAARFTIARGECGECAAALDAARLWRWRAEVHGQDPSPGDIEKAARRAGALNALPLITDGEFTVMGEPYRDISSHQHELLLNLSRERCAALSWAGNDDREDGE